MPSRKTPAGSAVPADAIHIRDLRLACVIGVNRGERTKRQDVVLNVTLRLDTRAAGKSDRIEDTANYRQITKDLIRLVEHSRFRLVERLAEEAAQACLAHPLVRAVTLVLDKPGALRHARSVAVEITRSKMVATSGKT